MTTAYSGDGITFPDNSVQATAPRVGMVNRIINGDMRIDQRNAGAEVTQIVGTPYTVDRFYIYGSVTSKFTAQQNAGSVTPPTGFINYLGMTSSSAYTVGASESFQVISRIEGLNIADLGWGTATAQTITLSFWVRSSLTGAFSGAIRNSAANRSYPFLYTVFTANTWEQKSVTIAGDTSGTWLTTNGTGIIANFSLGVGTTSSGTAGAWAAANYAAATGSTSVVGTSGATFYVTGVQLEVGSVATPFEHRQYGQELALCQRYYERKVVNVGGGGQAVGHGFQMAATTTSQIFVYPAVYMRANPSVTMSNLQVTDNTSWGGAATAFNGVGSKPHTVRLNVVHNSGGTSYRPCALQENGNGYLDLNAEL